MAGTCIDCATPVSRKSRTGRCRGCANRHNATRAEHRAAISAGLQRRWATDPAYAAAAADRARAAARCRDKAMMRERAIDNRLWEHGHRHRWSVSAPPGSAARARTGARISAAKLAHIPTDYRGEYRRLTRRGVPAAEAERMIRDQADADRRRFVASISEGQG